MQFQIRSLVHHKLSTYFCILLGFLAVLTFVQDDLLLVNIASQAINGTQHSKTNHSSGLRKSMDDLTRSKTKPSNSHNQSFSLEQRHETLANETLSGNATDFLLEQDGSVSLDETSNVKDTLNKLTEFVPNVLNEKLSNLRLANNLTVSLQNETHQNETLSNLNITILVQLSGEMGNQLAKISFGVALQHWAAQEYGINNTVIKLRAQENSKWYGAMKATKACFPKLKPYDFRSGNTPEFHKVMNVQREWLGKENSSLLEFNTGCFEECIEKGLSFLQSTLQQEKEPPHNKPNANISIPFLYANQFSYHELAIMDRFYKPVQQLFEFDEEACCKLQPEPDESVFHLRNYVSEMPRRGYGMGFEELSPNKTANELFAHLKKGDKIAITTRIKDDRLKKYVKALEARDLVVRVVDGQSPTEDFCFLYHTQKEFVGIYKSSFAFFAAYLGKAERVRLYSIDSPQTRKNLGDRFFLNYTWENEALKSKIFFELYESEEAEKQKKNTGS